MATFTVMADVPNPVADSNGDPFSGSVLKAFLPGTTTSTSIFIDSIGTSPQASITANAQGKWEVTGNEILPYIDRKHKWGIFANATDAAANTPFYMGPFDNVEQLTSPASTVNDERYGPIFATVAAMEAANPVAVDGLVVTLAIGMTADIQDYATGNNSGALTGVVVAGSTGTDDGGAFINLNNGLQWKQSFTDTLNVKQFGAKGDGTTDDLLPITAAIDRAITLDNGHVFFPVGKYNISANITKTLSATGSLHISGTGRELVELYWPNASSGLKFIYSAGGFWSKNPNGNALIVSSLAFTTDNVDVGVALETDGKSVAGRPAPGTAVYEVEVRGNINAATWAGGLKFVDTPSTNVVNFTWHGKIVDVLGLPIEYVGTLVTTQPTQHKLVNPEVTYAKNAVRAGDFVEGIHITNANFVFVDVGVRWVTVGTNLESLLTISSSHINSKVAGIILRGVQDSQIVGNLIWATSGLGTENSIRLDGAARTSIIGNVLQADGTGGTSTCITVQNAVTSSQTLYNDKTTTISGNSMSQADVAISLTADTKNAYVGRDNHATNVNARVVDSGNNFIETGLHSINVVKVLTGGSATEVVDIAIPAGIFTAKPAVGIMLSGETQAIQGYYDFGSASSTATNARFTVEQNDSSNLPAASVRFSIILTE